MLVQAAGPGEQSKPLVIHHLTGAPLPCSNDRRRQRSSLPASIPSHVRLFVILLLGSEALHLLGEKTLAHHPRTTASGLDSSVAVWTMLVDSGLWSLCLSAALFQIASSNDICSTTVPSSMAPPSRQEKHRPLSAWFSEWPSGRRPLSRTWPWNIKPSLMVLWGVCWQFWDSMAPHVVAGMDDEEAGVAAAANMNVEPSSWPAHVPQTRQAQPRASADAVRLQGTHAGFATSNNVNVNTNANTNTPSPSPSAYYSQQAQQHQPQPRRPSQQQQFIPPQPLRFDQDFSFHSAAPLGQLARPNSVSNVAYANSEYLNWPSPIVQSQGGWASAPPADTFHNPQTVTFLQATQPQSDAQGNTPRLRPSSAPRVRVIPPPQPLYNNARSPNSARIQSHYPFASLHNNMTTVEEPSSLPSPRSERSDHRGYSEVPSLGRNEASSTDEFATRDYRKNQEPPRNSAGKIICQHEDCIAKPEITFDRKCEWSKHMDKHERPYVCEEPGCEKLRGFTYSGGLLRHQREVHKKHGGPKDLLMCPVPFCKRNVGTGFTRKENLNEHIRRVHRTGGEEAKEEDANVIPASPFEMAPGVGPLPIPTPAPKIPRPRGRKRKALSGEEPEVDHVAHVETLLDEVKRLRRENETKDQIIADQAQTIQMLMPPQQQQMGPIPQ